MQQIYGVLTIIVLLMMVVKLDPLFGLAIDYFSPIGPLNFSLSETISKGKNDITESFRFNLGTTF